MVIYGYNLKISHQKGMKMARQSSDDSLKLITVSIRFPEKIYDWIKQRADKNRRSFNAQALLDIEHLMEQEKQHPDQRIE